MIPDAWAGAEVGCAGTVAAQEEGVDWAQEGAMRRGQHPGEWLMRRERTQSLSLKTRFLELPRKTLQDGLEGGVLQAGCFLQQLSCIWD